VPSELKCTIDISLELIGIIIPSLFLSFLSKSFVKTPSEYEAKVMAENIIRLKQLENSEAFDQLSLSSEGNAISDF